MALKFDITGEKKLAEAILDDIRSAISELKAALDFSWRLKDAATKEILDTRALVTKSQTLIETSQKLLQQQRPPVEM